MVRSTHSSPSPQSLRNLRKVDPPLHRPLVLYDSTDDEVETDNEDRSSSSSMSNRMPAVVPSTLSDVSMHNSEDEVNEDLVADKDIVDVDDIADEDDIYLRSIAQAAVSASQTAAAAEDIYPRLSPRQSLGNAKRHEYEALFRVLLDSVKRSDLFRQEFSEFVPPNVRLTMPVPKVVSKTFVKTKAEKFVRMYDLYVTMTRLSGDISNLLHAFETFLGDLMDCFDHPQEVIGWNPFRAFAVLVEAGAVLRTPGVVQSCSRLTLGADWGMLSVDDKRKIGPVLHAGLLQLHLFRIAEIDELLCRWSDKFRRGSTCTTCNTDPWEIFLLSTVLSLKKSGTRYIDIETASDTSSEPCSDVCTDEEASKGHDNGDSDEDDNEQDDHHGRDSDSSDGDSDPDSDGCIDPRLIFASIPCDDTQEPPRAPTSSDLVPRQCFLRNYGPNAYVLRIVSMDEFGCEPWAKRQMNACPRCGYRFDGKDPDPSSLYAKDIARAVEVARDQISALQEVIDLP